MPTKKTPRKQKKVKYPATQVVHWPTGPVSCCEVHGAALAGLGRMLGSHIAVTQLTDFDKQECSNCINEAPRTH